MTQQIAKGILVSCVLVTRAADKGVGFNDSKVQFRNLTASDGLNYGLFQWFTRTWNVKNNESNVSEVYFTMKPLQANNQKWNTTAGLDNKFIEITAGVVSPKVKVDDSKTEKG